MDPEIIGRDIDRDGTIDQLISNSGFPLAIGISPPEGFALMDCDWHHVALTFDQDTSTVRLYVDSVFIGSRTVDESLSTSLSSGLRIGEANGECDEFAVYDTVLTPTQIAEHFTAGVSADGSLCAPTPTDSYGTAVLADSPALFLRPDPAADASVVFDAAGNCSNGAMGSGATAAAGHAGQIGAAASVPEDTFAIGHSGDGLPVEGESSTIELWHRGNAASRQYVWRHGSRYALQIQPSIAGTSSFYFDDGVESTNIRPVDGHEVSDGEWHHIVAVFDGDTSKVTMCMDGVLIESTTLSTDFSPVLQNGLRIGDRAGEYDEIAVYDHMLTPEQILAHYQAAG